MPPGPGRGGGREAALLPLEKHAEGGSQVRVLLDAPAQLLADGCSTMPLLLLLLLPHLAGGKSSLMLLLLLEVEVCLASGGGDLVLLPPTWGWGIGDG